MKLLLYFSHQVYSANLVMQLEAIFIQMFPRVQRGLNILSRMFGYADRHVDIIGCGEHRCMHTFLSKL